MDSCAPVNLKNNVCARMTAATMRQIQLTTHSDFVSDAIISLLVGRVRGRHLTNYFPFFSTNPGQFASAFVRLPLVSLLKSSRTPLLY